MQNFLLLFLAFATGGIVATYLTVNSLMADMVGSNLQANLPYFLLALLVTFVLFLFIETPGQLASFREVPWWLFLAGVAGGLALFATTIVIGSLGPDKFFVASVAGQLVASVLLAHFGWLGSAEDPINWQKATGVLLAIAGAVLVNFSGE